MVGTATENGAEEVMGVRVGPIAEMIPSACAAANVWLRIARVEMEQVG